MNTELRFPIYIVFAYFIFYALMFIAIGKRNEWPLLKRKVLWMGLIVVVLGMLFGKYGLKLGLPWWVYYTVPMLVTVILPPVYFKMNKREAAWYYILSFLSAPFIHYFFALLIGWKDYMPFLNR
jgi:hypothetical protein